MPETLPKSERLSGQSAVSALFERGKGLSSGCLRCKYILRPQAPASAPLAPLSRADAGVSRIVVSVPKRLFKRAVKRNLLKRRIREAYRHQKDLVSAPVDILFIYTAPEVLPYEVIYADMTAVLLALNSLKQNGLQV
ncbi:MAG: ribonuclease P protein component [Bacteroidales bacterium]|nr:ribonuclease P protein component [Bacteroidales bacterium]